MDQIYCFNFSTPKGAETVNPRTGVAGLLELACLNTNEGRTFLFKGSMSLKECEEAVAMQGDSTYLVAANKFSRGQVLWDGNQTSFTVYCEQEGRAYVRISER